MYFHLIGFFFQPHDHQKKVAKFYWATPELIKKAIDTSLKAKVEWERIPIDEKISMFLKISEDMAGKYRAQLNAATMLGQAKTVIQVKSLFSSQEIVTKMIILQFLFHCFYQG